MKANSRLDSSIKILVNPRPVIAGKVRTLMSSCGKPGCKCMKKNNPEKHPYHQLSYTEDKKTKTMYVKKSDFASIEKMTDNYQALRQASLDLGHEAAALIKTNGAEEAGKIMMDSFDRARRKIMGIKVEAAILRNTRFSRDNWKNKALARQNALEKNRVKIRDMKKSREKWKNKAIKAQKKVEKLRKKVVDAEKKISKTEKNDNSKKKLQ